MRVASAGHSGSELMRIHACHRPGLGLYDDTGLMPLCLQAGKNAGRGLIQIQQNIAGVTVARVRTKVHVVVFAIRNAQEAGRSRLQELRRGPPPHARIGSARDAVNQAHFKRQPGKASTWRRRTASVTDIHHQGTNGIHRCPARCGLGVGSDLWPVERCAWNNRCDS